jgi:hypothetical protein
MTGTAPGSPVLMARIIRNLNQLDIHEILSKRKRL